MADFDFLTDTDTLDPVDYGPIPDGTYTAVIQRAEVRDCASGRGRALTLGMVIDGGEHAGRWVWDHPLVSHDSMRAQAIGRRKVRALMRAVGLPEEPPESAGVLVGHSVQIQVGSEVWRGSHRNTVRAYSAPAPAPAPAPATEDDLDDVLADLGEL